MQSDGLTFPEAVRALAERSGIEVEQERGERSEVDRAKKSRDELYAANQVAATFFEEQLSTHPHRDCALRELARRGLTSENAAASSAMRSFRIGYAPSGWDALVLFLKKQSISPIVAETAGLIVPRSSGTGYYDRFRHRLMFPVIDHQGRVVAFSGRKLDDPQVAHASLSADAAPKIEKEAVVLPKYINSPESPIYTKGGLLFGLFQARNAIRQQESAIVVEGNFDVVTLHAQGVEHVVAPLGTAFTSDQARLLKRYCETVVLLFDGDAAGKKAVLKSREGCQSAGLTTKVAVLPDGIDPDEFVRTKGVDALKEVVARARGVLEHLIDEALDETFVASDALERAGRVAQVSKLLAEQNDPLVRSMAKAYADKLAGRLDMARSPDAFRALERAVGNALQSASREASGGGDPKRARVRPRAPGSLERAEMVGAIIEYPSLLDDSIVCSELALLDGLAARAVAAVSAGRSRGAFDSGALLAQIPVSIRSFAAERLAAPKHDTPEVARAHVVENAQKLRRILLSRETVELAREQEKIVGDWSAEIELAREANSRARLMHGVTPSVPSGDGVGVGDINDKSAFLPLGKRAQAGSYGDDDKES